VKIEDTDGKETEYLAVNNDPIIMAAINAIKELNDKNNTLQKELDDSKKEFDRQLQALEKRLMALEAK